MGLQDNLERREPFINAVYLKKQYIFVGVKRYGVNCADGNTIFHERLLKIDLRGLDNL